jgi:hypothetical protein
VGEKVIMPLHAGIISRLRGQISQMAKKTLPRVDVIDVVAPDTG